MINEEAALDSTLMPVLMRFKGLGKKKEARKQLPHPREMSDAAIAVPDFSFFGGRSFNAVRCSKQSNWTKSAGPQLFEVCHLALF